MVETVQEERGEIDASSQISRRSFLRNAVAVCGLAGLAGYSSLIEPNRIDVTHIEIRLDRLPMEFDGLRIAHISDLHHGPYTGNLEIGKAVDAVNALKPDAIAVTGDFVTHSSYKRVVRHMGPCAQLLSRLRAPLGVYAVLGNHDQLAAPDFIADTLHSHGIQVLRNGAVAWQRERARLWLAGVDDVLEGRPSLDLARAKAPKDEAVVLLAHEPDYADVAAQHSIDLQLSGHSHGGQIHVPHLESLWLPPLSRKYPHGHYQVGRMQLYTNRGIGVIGVPVRFECLPEVTLLTLRAGRAL